MNIAAHNHFHDFAEIEQLVVSFESCTIDPAKFHHNAHLLVALWYLFQLPEPAAYARMRESLRRFTSHHQSEGYNETLTLFWLKLVGHSLGHGQARRSLIEHAHELLATYADSHLVYKYYSRERIHSPEAKHAWVEPDLKPLDF